MTPAEMADWLERCATEPCEYPGPDPDVLMVIAAHLRRQPTDAQKIEALKLAAEASAMGELAEAFDAAGDARCACVSARESASDARKAMRLLGLPTE